MDSDSLVSLLLVLPDAESVAMVAPLKSEQHPKVEKIDNQVQKLSPAVVNHKMKPFATLCLLLFI